MNSYDPTDVAERNRQIVQIVHQLQSKPTTSTTTTKITTTTTTTTTTITKTTTTSTGLTIADLSKKLASSGLVSLIFYFLCYVYLTEIRKP